MDKACPSKNFSIEKCWDSVVFCLDFSEFGYVTKIFYAFYWVMFQKNIEIVWEIEKICNIAKFRKIKAKTTESRDFSMLKFLDGQAL